MCIRPNVCRCYTKYVNFSITSLPLPLSPPLFPSLLLSFPLLSPPLPFYFISFLTKRFSYTGSTCSESACPYDCKNGGQCSAGTCKYDPFLSPLLSFFLSLPLPLPLPPSLPPSPSLLIFNALCQVCIRVARSRLRDEEGVDTWHE